LRKLAVLKYCGRIRQWIKCKFSYTITRTVTDNYKGKGHPITRHEGTEGQ